MTTVAIDLIGRHAAGRPGLTRWPALRWELAFRRRHFRWLVGLARLVPAIGAVEMATWAALTVAGAYVVVLAGVWSRMPG